jgi:phosphoglycerate dehydrogenase-like enzyme
MAATVLFCTDTFWDDRSEEIVSINPAVEVIRLVGDHQVTQSELDRMTAAFFSPDCWPERTKPFLGACLRAPNLKWLHTMSAGTDAAVFARLAANGVTVTNSAGAAAPAIAQSVLLSLLALSRDLPESLRAQAARRWHPRPSVDLPGLRLGIVGLGQIGREVARLATAFGIDVIGLRRSVTGSEPCQTWSVDRLGELLRWADAIAVTAPLTPATRGLFGTEAFATMRRGAWFINVGRGEIVDEPALVSALAGGHLGGAALDVFATEPLPADSPLWGLPNAIITPHSSGSTAGTDHRVVDVFVDNFRRHTAGLPLFNVVEPGR